MSITTGRLGRAVVGVALAVLLGWGWGGGPVLASEPQQGVEAADPDRESLDGRDALTEQSIYIPYKKLREVFEREGRGVFIPYERFAQLWQAARGTDPSPIDDAPPVEALVVTTDNDATVTGDVVEVDSTVRIDVFKTGLGEGPAAAGRLGCHGGDDRRRTGPGSIRARRGLSTALRTHG